MRTKNALTLSLILPAILIDSSCGRGSDVQESAATEAFDATYDAESDSYTLSFRM